MKKLLLALLVVILLVACGTESAPIEDPTEDASQSLPGYVPVEADVFSDGQTIEGTIWTNVTWVEAQDSHTGVVFYQANIAGETVHIIFDPQAGTDYFLESDVTLIQGLPFEMVDPYGISWGTLKLEADGTVTWTAPDNGTYVPDAPTPPSSPQVLG